MFRSTSTSQQAPVLQLMEFLQKSVESILDVDAAVEEGRWLEKHAEARVEKLGQLLYDVDAQLSEIEIEVGHCLSTLGKVSYGFIAPCGS